MKSRSIIFSAAALAGALALAGCSGSSTGSGGAAPTGPGPAGGMATASVPDTAGPQLTGTQLTAALLTASSLPVTGFSAAGPVTSSGGSLGSASAKTTLSTISCAAMLQDLGAQGFGENAMASDVLASSIEVFAQAVYQFPSATAANAFFTSFDAKWNTCGTVHEPASGGTSTLMIKPATAPSGLAEMAFEFTETGTVTSGSVADTVLVVLKGADTYLIEVGGFGKAQPTDLPPQALIQKLMSNVAGS